MIRQIQSGYLVCPKTKKKLIIDKGHSFLTSIDGTEKYQILNKQIPILLINNEWANNYIKSSERMIKEYQIGNSSNPKSTIKAWLSKDFRTNHSITAFHDIFDKLPKNSLCISIGGGPTRAHSILINLNIGPFPNVDIVADAHSLPYADECVDAIYCEAALEHFHDPCRAVKEMHRVLRKDGKVFAVTPFLQSYHGYPYHYQNFTLTGHKYLFESNNFELLSNGTCVGPMFTITDLISVFIEEYFPFLEVGAMHKMGTLTRGLLRFLGKDLNYKKNSHILASSTYVVAIKK